MRGGEMDKSIDSNFAIIMLIDMLLEENLIKKTKFEAIENKMKSENRTFNKTNKSN